MLQPFCTACAAQVLDDVDDSRHLFDLPPKPKLALFLVLAKRIYSSSAPLTDAMAFFSKRAGDATGTATASGAWAAAAAAAVVAWAAWRRAS